MLFEGKYLPDIMPYLMSSSNAPACHCCGTQRAQVSLIVPGLRCSQFYCFLPRASLHPHGFNKRLGMRTSEGQATHILKWPLTNRDWKPWRNTAIPHFIALCCMGLHRCCIFLQTEGKTRHQQEDYSLLSCGGLKPNPQRLLTPVPPSTLVSDGWVLHDFSRGPQNTGPRFPQ